MEIAQQRPGGVSGPRRPLRGRGGCSRSGCGDAPPILFCLDKRECAAPGGRENRLPRRRRRRRWGISEPVLCFGAGLYRLAPGREGAEGSPRAGKCTLGRGGRRMASAPVPARSASLRAACSAHRGTLPFRTGERQRKEQHRPFDFPPSNSARLRLRGGHLFFWTVHGPFVSGPRAAAKRRLASDTRLRAQSFRRV